MSTSKSRPSTQLRTWWSASFAPVIQPIGARDRRIGDDDRDVGMMRSDVALRQLGVRGEVLVGVQPHRRGASAADSAYTLTSRSPGTSASPSSPSTSNAMHFSSASARRRGTSATGAMPGMSGVCTFSIGGASTARPLAGATSAAPCGFDVGGVVARPAPHEVVLADRGDGHELVVHVAADLARLRLRPARNVRPQRVEDAAVRVVHLAVARAQPVEVGVEGVRVLHQELAAAQQPEARAQLVAVLPVDLVQVDGQVAVRRVLLRDDRRHRPPRPSATRQKPVSLRSSRRNMSGPYAASRPVRCHSSSGLEDRQERLLRARRGPSPRARSARPCAAPGSRAAATRRCRPTTRRMKPARTSSRWLSTSASAGSSRKVRRNSATSAWLWDHSTSRRWGLRRAGLRCVLL